ncbi:MAG: hypothetical protein ACI8P3_003545 [Saprospiraceae bacterium]|jgi:hypothetical protein
MCTKTGVRGRGKVRNWIPDISNNLVFDQCLLTVIKPTKITLISKQRFDISIFVK